MSGKAVIKCSPHLKRVTTLPCETLVLKIVNYIVLQTFNNNKQHKIIFAASICTLLSSTKPCGMQSSIFLCLSQARINLQGCGRKGIRRKNGGMMEVARLLVRRGGAQLDCRCIYLLSSLAPLKSRR